ncbi:MAG: hypothetical protein KGH81_07290, partial [Thaumarchaeota archaeon]|nr:hypothetical protein [Nitrososphaerota archaeon]
FNAPSGTQNPYVYESALTYYVPTPGMPTKPVGFTCGTSGASQCIDSVWSGITTQSGGVGQLVQSGTDSVCSGTSGTACGTTSYRAWLQIFDGPGSGLNQESFCDQNPPHNPPLTPKANDEILAQTTNEARYNGNNYDYDVYVDDITQNIQCSTTGWVYNVGNPNYGLYMVERPSFSGVLSKLAEFSPPSDTISSVYGTIWYNSLNNGIQVPYDAGSGLEYYMQNGGVTNVSPSTVSSSRFTLTWNTSQNTG